jgi:hypothetical protein
VRSYSYIEVDGNIKPIKIDWERRQIRVRIVSKCGLESCGNTWSTSFGNLVLLFKVEKVDDKTIKIHYRCILYKQYCRKHEWLEPGIIKKDSKDKLLDKGYPALIAQGIFEHPFQEGIFIDFKPLPL